MTSAVRVLTECCSELVVAHFLFWHYSSAKRPFSITDACCLSQGSSIMPKKQRVIEGVGVSSMMALQAQLYRTQVQTTFPLPASSPGTAMLSQLCACCFLPSD